MAKLTWHGHSCFLLETDEGTRIIIDPWLDQNPAADVKAADIGDLDFILVTHGHADHFADAIPLARRTGATLVSAFEIVSFVQSQGVENAHPLGIGGGYTFSFGYAKMTPALHGGEVAGDDEGKFTTMPGGWWLELNGGKRVYHAGDTALLTDMKLLEGMVDVALLPIGDNFTMGPRDAIRAVDFIKPKIVIPMHYNTFDVIKQDPHAFARAVGNKARVVVLEPGGTFEF
jgi:L-ascorbate metabolism protein UlaG (beta-lactamase superfamily)